MWVWILLGEHIVSYFFSIFRNWEVKEKGTTNSYGIDTAPIESKMRIFEIFIDVVIFGAIIFHGSQMTYEEIYA
jgi:hypothetical protein